MSKAMALATSVAFIWAGMVLGISFLETPLKFRAPGVTTRIGLGIGRLVFRTFNWVELGFATVLVIAVIVDVPATRIAVSMVMAVVALAVQVVLVRPVLTRRSNRVLAGEDAPRSTAHYWYLSLEVAKLAALLTSGAWLLNT
jgi:hypothetical protein